MAKETLRDIFKIPKQLRQPLIETRKRVSLILENVDSLKTMGIITDQDITDMKNLLEIAKRAEDLTSEREEDVEPTGSD